MSGKGSGRVSAAGLICFKPGARSRFFYQIRVHTGRKGERRSMSEADYAGLVTAAHNQLHAPLILAQQGWACMISLPTQNWKIWCDVPNVSANLDNRK